MKIPKIFALTLVLPSLLFHIEALAQTSTSKVEWSSFNMGFAMPAATNTTVQSVAGQSFVGATSNANNCVESGFLAYFSHCGFTTAVSENRYSDMPSDFELEQNYPNPFNPSTAIRFAVPKPAHVTIKIFDALGREVRTLVAREFQAGDFIETWDARNNDGLPVTSGVYLVRMQAEGFVQTRNLTLLR